MVDLTAPLAVVLNKENGAGMDILVRWRRQAHPIMPLSGTWTSGKPTKPHFSLALVAEKLEKVGIQRSPTV